MGGVSGSSRSSSSSGGSHSSSHGSSASHGPSASRGPGTSHANGKPPATGAHARLPAGHSGTSTFAHPNPSRPIGPNKPGGVKPPPARVESPVIKLAQNGGSMRGLGGKPPVGPAHAQGKPAPVPKNPGTSLKDWLKVNEGGAREKVYLDSKKHPTVGIGHNMDQEGTKKLFKDLGIDYKAVKAGRATLSPQQIDALYAHDVKAAESAARKVLGDRTYDGLNDARKTVVIDMAFNLGETKLAKFKDMIAALRNSDFEQAAREMKDSAWNKQTGYRSQSDIDSMRQGQLSSVRSGKRK